MLTPGFPKKYAPFAAFGATFWLAIRHLLPSEGQWTELFWMFFPAGDQKQGSGFDPEDGLLIELDGQCDGRFSIAKNSVSGFGMGEIGGTTGYWEEPKISRRKFGDEACIGSSVGLFGGGLSMGVAGGDDTEGFRLGRQGLRGTKNGFSVNRVHRFRRRVLPRGARTFGPGLSQLPSECSIRVTVSFPPGVVEGEPLSLTGGISRFLSGSDKGGGTACSKKRCRENRRSSS